MCVDYYESEEAEQAHRRWKRAGSCAFFLILVGAMLLAFFLLAPPAPAVDPLLRSVW